MRNPCIIPQVRPQVYEISYRHWQLWVHMRAGIGDTGLVFFWFACQKSYQESPFAVLDRIWQTPRDDTYKSIFDHTAGQSAQVNAPATRPLSTLSLDLAVPSRPPTRSHTQIAL